MQFNEDDLTVDLLRQPPKPAAPCDLYVHPSKVQEVVEHAMASLRGDAAFDTVVVEYALPRAPSLVAQRGWVLSQEYRNVNLTYFRAEHESSRICMVGHVAARSETGAMPRRMMDTILASSGPSVDPRQGMLGASTGSSICPPSDPMATAMMDTAGDGLDMFLLQCTHQHNLVHGSTNMRVYLESAATPPVQHPECLESVHHMCIYKNSEAPGFELEGHINSVNWVRQHASGEMRMQLPTDIWIVRCRVRHATWRCDLPVACTRLAFVAAQAGQAGQNGQEGQVDRKRRRTDED